MALGHGAGAAAPAYCVGQLRMGLPRIPRIERYAVAWLRRPCRLTL
jgi:hypothetical protein